MKKILLLLSVIAFFSCSNEEIYNEKENVSQNLPEEKFNITQSDIEKIVTDYCYSTRTRAKGSSCEIAEIDTISNNANSGTRATIDRPHNLLYVVRMSDGSTVIVGGDKRAEPVYAHFDNLNLKINEKGEFVGDSIPEIIGNLMENYIVDVKNKATANNQVNSYYSNRQQLNTRAGDSNDEVLPKLAYRFTDAYKYNENHKCYNTFSSQDIRPWTIHALCIAIPDGKEIRSFDKYQLKASWKQAKKLDVTQLKGDMYTDFVEMCNRIPQIKWVENTEISGFIAFEAVKNFFSGADGIPSLSYDTDWFNMLNNLRLETGISYIYGYRDRRHPTFFRHTSYHNFSFFLADGYKKIKGDYYIHVVGPIGNYGIVSGYVLDFNRKNAGRFEHSHWTEWYGVPYKTNTLNIHTTKYLLQ